MQKLKLEIGKTYVDKSGRLHTILGKRYSYYSDTAYARFCFYSKHRVFDEDGVSYSKRAVSSLLSIVDIKSEDFDVWEYAPTYANCIVKVKGNLCFTKWKDMMGQYEFMDFKYKGELPLRKPKNG